MGRIAQGPCECGAITGADHRPSCPIWSREANTASNEMLADTVREHGARIAVALETISNALVRIANQGERK